jgi:hypothetical protein
MVIVARRQLTQCGGRPMLMGRSGAPCEALILLTEMAERYSGQAALLVNNQQLFAVCVPR